MARILVADDNSNIQKMVGLALKDQGIDVVAVGNGEAAVRKISDIRPDLVLADVFMPVRNGYEVCQYVKSDPTLAHIPVILLVGAFDPLDEQEAQRVGADGVLKKPFVPPDPLISMVKSALARAGVSIGGVAPPPQVKEVPVRVAEMITPRTATPSLAVPSMSSLAPVREFPLVDSEPVQEETPAPPERVKINAGSQPLAFGNLLESPVTEPEEELGYATTARPQLERDWKSGGKEDEVVEEEEETESASWRRDGGGEAMEESGPAKDWRETAFADAPARKMRNESWAPPKEISTFEEAAETEQSVGAIVTDALITETRVPPPATAPYAEEAWVTALRPKIAVEAAMMEAPAAEPAVPAAYEQQVAAHVPAEVHREIPVIAPAPEATVPEPEKLAAPATSSWFSSVASPWDEEVQKASRLASTWDAPVMSLPAASTASETVVYAGHEELQEEVLKGDPAATVDALTPLFGEDMKAKAERAALPEATVEAIREEAQHVAEAAVQQTPAVDTSAKAPEPSMEDLVAKVLAKMSPDMLQAVTRDILKNVVESMVRDELNAKKQ
ncbi:MAG TPA: response regulator [Candidatus Cybelea sp.]|nr:response regulator [Candidatus Cybelea sp.]